MRSIILILAASALATSAAAQDRNPNWLRKPDPNDINAMIPEKAAKAGISGKTIVRCAVTPTGALTDCVLLRETPPNMGFGHAALLLAPSFLMTPKIHNAVAVAGQVTIPINFDLPKVGPDTVFLGASYRVVNALPWTSAPASQEMAAAFPAPAKGKMESGQVILRCHLESDGTLSHCDIASENPKAFGFANAAKSLVPRFRASTEDIKIPLKTIRVDLPFHFIDPASAAWRTRGLTKPAWETTVDPEAGDAVYPRQAIAAKIETGRADVHCDVAVGGGLTGCRAQSEQPAGYGFGDAGVKIASVFKMRPWTDDGMPVDGLSVVMPIKLDRPDETPPPAPTQPAATSSSQGSMITKMRWLRKPDGEDMAHYAPAILPARGQSGGAVMVCTVTEEGTLRDCAVTREEPPGMGFGAATLRLASKFRSAPTDGDGMPVAGRQVAIPIRWTMR